MGKKTLAWFIQQWLLFFEQQVSTNHWQRGKMNYHHHNVRHLEIQKGMLKAYVKGLDTYQVKVLSHSLTAQDQAEWEKNISAYPTLLMKIYQRTLAEDDVENKPNQLGFHVSDMEVSCSCGGNYCPHLVAVALAAAECFQGDYSQFLIFNGLDWESVLSHFGNLEEEDDVMWGAEDFALLPVPEGSIRSFESRMGGSPEFWMSSFSFQRMLEEILSKIREEE